MQTYMTQAGDSLWSIAERFYGDGNTWPVIHEANQGVIGADPNTLHAGLTLTIPDQSAWQTYVTQSGDSLWSIAQRFYGDGNRWQNLYQINQNVIGPDANALPVGVALSIPPANL